LFVDRARLVQPGLAADAPERAAVAEICRLADGLPLAVELAAAHARTLPIPAIRDGVADRLRFLAAREPADAPPHPSLAASLDRSADLVGPAAGHALAALSVVDGRFPLEVALAVTAGDREALETLVDHSLVQFEARDGRYLLLDTVRAYAGAALAASGGADETRRRLLDWALAFARDVRDGLERADPEALRRADSCDAAVTSALAGRLPRVGLPTPRRRPTSPSPGRYADGAQKVSVRSSGSRPSSTRCRRRCAGRTPSSPPMPGTWSRGLPSLRSRRRRQPSPVTTAAGHGR
jgi:hypothetical protein